MRGPRLAVDRTGILLQNPLLACRIFLRKSALAADAICVKGVVAAANFPNACCRIRGESRRESDLGMRKSVPTKYADNTDIPDVPRFSVYGSLAINWIPMLSPLATMYFVPQYRRAISGFFRPKVYAVERSNDGGSVVKPNNEAKTRPIA